MSYCESHLSGGLRWGRRGTLLWRVYTMASRLCTHFVWAFSAILLVMVSPVSAAQQQSGSTTGEGNTRGDACGLAQARARAEAAQTCPAQYRVGSCSCRESDEEWTCSVRWTCADNSPDDAGAHRRDQIASAARRAAGSAGTLMQEARTITPGSVVPVTNSAAGRAAQQDAARPAASLVYSGFDCNSPFGRRVHIQNNRRDRSIRVTVRVTPRDESSRRRHPDIVSSLAAGERRFIGCDAHVRYRIVGVEE